MVVVVCVCVGGGGGGGGGERERERGGSVRACVCARVNVCVRACVYARARVCVRQRGGSLRGWGGGGLEKELPQPES